MSPFHIARAIGMAAASLGVSAALPAQLMGHSSNSQHGFPSYYVDTAGNTASHCYQWTDPLCGLTPGDDPAYGQLLDVSSGVFWGESFYWLCTADAELPGGSLVVVFALEGVFGNANEAIVPGDQTVFSRIRFRLDTQVPGEYEILHPFGENTFSNVGIGRRAIDYTQDCLHTVDANGVIVPSCGVGVGNMFSTGLMPGISRIDRFLHWDPDVAPAAPDGYYGNPAIPHRIAGASNGRNSVIVRGPAIGGPGVNEVEITEFSIMGRKGPSPSLTSEPRYIDTSAGGAQTLYLDSGPAAADDGYFILSTIMTTAPGITLPNGLQIPLSIDGLMAFAVQDQPAPFAINYAGVLDSNGQATATLHVPPIPALAGIDLYQAYLSGTPGSIEHASNNTTLSLR